MTMRSMTLEEILANPKMNPFFPSPYLAFVSSDHPVHPRELVRVERTEERAEEERRRKREAIASRPVQPGHAGTFGDWSVVYREETIDDAIPFEDALAKWRMIE